MKKLLLLLFLVPIVSFGQEESTRFLEKKAEGIFYVGNGEYKVIRVGSSGFVSLKRLTKKAEIDMNDFASENQVSVKMVKVDKMKSTFGVYPQVTLYFRAFDKDGNIVLNDEDKKNLKKEAMEELKRLKDLLEMDLLTQEEFDKKAAELKKVILGN